MGNLIYSIPFHTCQLKRAQSKSRRLNRMLREGRFADRNSAAAGAFMAAVLEYITAEVVEQAGEIVKERKAQRILPKDLNLAIRQDPLLSQMCALTQIAESFRPAHVEEALLPKKKGAKAAAAT